MPAFRRLLDRYPTIQDWIMPVVVEVDEAGMWNIGLKGSDGSVVDVLEVP